MEASNFALAPGWVRFSVAVGFGTASLVTLPFAAPLALFLSAGISLPFVTTAGENIYHMYDPECSMFDQ